METSRILKWINELQCEIDRVKKSGGGSNITITPVATEGEKVADIEVDGDIVSLFGGLLKMTNGVATLFDGGDHYVKCKYITGTQGTADASQVFIPTGIPIANIIGYFGQVADSSTPSPNERYAFPQSSKVASFLKHVDTTSHPANTYIRASTWSVGANSSYKILVFYTETKPITNTRKARTKK